MRTTDFTNYLFRCSSLGKLMTGVKPNLTENQEKTLVGLIEKKDAGKITDKQMITLGDLLEKKHAKPSLSKTTQSYLKELHRNEVFCRSNEITSKFLDKGIQCEERSLSLLCKTEGNWFQKNKERFKNDFITGEPDNTQGKIRDIKTSWNFSTFPMYETEIPNKDYYWQLQGYMDLTGIDESELIYCLVDTPFKLIDDELRRMDWKFDIMDGNGEIREQSIPLVVEMLTNHIFSRETLREYCETSPNVREEWFINFNEIPPEMRIKKFEVRKDQKAIEILYGQIERGREFLNDLSIEIAKNLEVTT